MTPGKPQINGPEGGYRVGRYREFAIPPALRRVAEVGWCFGPGEPGSPADAMDTPLRILPETGVSLTVALSRDHDGSLEDLSLVVMGPIVEVRFFRPTSRTEMLGVRLRAEWCRDLLGCHPRDVVDTMEDALPRQWADDLVGRLARTRDTPGAASELLAMVAGRAQLIPAKRATHLAHAALERLRAHDAPPGAVRDTAQALGVSLRHLRRAVDDSCGCGMKWFQRVRRLHRAVSAVPLHGKPSWSALAAAAGYYDQAHMINEFRALSGATPVELLAERSAL